MANSAIPRKVVDRTMPCPTSRIDFKAAVDYKVLSLR
jgi:hypothetical protein